MNMCFRQLDSNLEAWCRRQREQLMSLEGMGSARKATGRETKRTRAVSWGFLHYPSVSTNSLLHLPHTPTPLFFPAAEGIYSYWAFTLSQSWFTSSQPVISLNHENSSVRLVLQTHFTEDKTETQGEKSINEMWSEHKVGIKSRPPDSCSVGHLSCATIYGEYNDTGPYPPGGYNLDSNKLVT